MNENPRFGKVQILVFAKRFSPFCFFESHFISRKQKRKNRATPRFLDIKKRPKLGCLIFEFQISTSIHSGAGVLTAFERADPILIKIEAQRSGFNFGRKGSRTSAT